MWPCHAKSSDAAHKHLGNVTHCKGTRYNTSAYGFASLILSNIILLHSLHALRRVAVASQSLTLEQPMHAVNQRRLYLALAAEYLYSAVSNVNAVNYENFTIV
jgi:hypothetical protein